MGTQSRVMIANIGPRKDRKIYHRVVPAKEVRNFDRSPFFLMDLPSKLSVKEKVGS